MINELILISLLQYWKRSLIVSMSFNLAMLRDSPGFFILAFGQDLPQVLKVIWNVQSFQEIDLSTAHKAPSVVGLVQLRELWMTQDLITVRSLLRQHLDQS